MRLVRSGSLVTDDTPLCDILARTTATWNVDFIMESSDPTRLPIRIRRGENGDEEEFIYEDSQDIPEKYPIYDPEKGTLTVKISKGEYKCIFRFCNLAELFYLLKQPNVFPYPKQNIQRQITHRIVGYHFSSRLTPPESFFDLSQTCYACALIVLLVLM